jgi:hypothetical protein
VDPRGPPVVRDVDEEDDDDWSIDLSVEDDGAFDTVRKEQEARNDLLIAEMDIEFMKANNKRKQEEIEK